MGTNPEGDPSLEPQSLLGSDIVIRPVRKGSQFKHLERVGRQNRSLVVTANEADQFPLNLDLIGAKNPGLIGGIGGFQRDGGAFFA